MIKKYPVITINHVLYCKDNPMENKGDSKGIDFRMSLILTLMMGCIVTLPIWILIGIYRLIKHIVLIMIKGDKDD